MLGEQAAVSIRALDAFARWAAGDAEQGEIVRAAEHEADERKRDLLALVRDAFSTPLDPEDLFELSRGLDEVVNGAKNAVREADALSMAPNAPMGEMSALLADGVRMLGESFASLAGDAERAHEHAAAAVKTQRNLERCYRAAMAELAQQEDIREVVGRQELYRRLARMSDAILEVADRVTYAIVKEG
jgi:uncharacterized protein Yka (UPF0111/DUF47 family)